MLDQDSRAEVGFACVLRTVYMIVGVRCVTRW